MRAAAGPPRAAAVGSLFAGIGGFDLGFERAGFKLAWHAEIDKAASAILRYRWPDVPNMGDVTKIGYCLHGLSELASRETTQPGLHVRIDVREPMAVWAYHDRVVQGETPALRLRDDVVDIARPLGPSASHTRGSKKTTRSHHPRPLRSVSSALGDEVDAALVPRGDAFRAPRMSPRGDEEAVLDLCGGRLPSLMAGGESTLESTVDRGGFSAATLAGFHGFYCTSCKKQNPAFVDIVTGGFPCQDVSVAGKRAGLAGARTGLFHDVVRIVKEMREVSSGRYPTFILAENVPGLLSSNGGRDMAVVLGEFMQLGARDVAWRTLDSRYFGVAQRRRRVFVVVDFGGERAEEILAIREGLRGDPPSSRAAREDVAGTLGGGAEKRGWCDDLDRTGAFVAGTLSSNHGNIRAEDAWGGKFIANTLRADGFDASEDGTGRGVPLVADPISAHEQSTYTHEGSGNFRLRNVIPFDERNVTSPANRSRCEPGDPCHTMHVAAPAVAFRTAQHGANGIGARGDAAYTLDGAAQGVAPSGVRRLTPRECERLQGFPDVAKSIIIRVCGEKQGNGADAALRNLRSRRDASRAEESALKLFAPYADLRSPTLRPDLDSLADVSVLIDSERWAALIHSRGRSLWSANNAEDLSWSLLPMPRESFARLVVDTISTPGLGMPCGEAASLPNSELSVAHSNGSAPVRQYGRGTSGRAGGVGPGTKTVAPCSTFITSPVTASSRLCALSGRTSCSSVASAIASFIPEQTWRENGFALRLTVVSPWTAIPGMADGPRYKCLGNAVTVNVAEWLARRIA